MTPETVIRHFRTQEKVAKALGISQPSVSNWVSRGAVPALQQLRLEKLTRGKLKAELSVFKSSRVVVSRSNRSSIVQI